MNVEYLELIHYRNLEILKMTDFGMCVIFFGLNAQGKTNLLESLYILSMGRAFRTRSCKDLVAFDKDFSNLKMLVRHKNGDSIKLEMNISKYKRRFFRNGILVNRLSSHIGKTPVVLFSPDDLNLIDGFPIFRRRFLDHAVSQVLPSYVYFLNNCRRLLLHRNQCFKDLKIGLKNNSSNVLLETIDEQFFDFCLKVWSARNDWIIRLVKKARDIYRALTDGCEDLEIKYKPCLGIEDHDYILDGSDNWLHHFQHCGLNLLSDLRLKEQRLGVTLWGPHRDEVAFFINGRNASVFGSQGQKRTVVLSIKLAELDCLSQSLGISPILLLDDCFSELDEYRKRFLLKWVYGRVQTFITTTTPLRDDYRELLDAQLFNIVKGSVRLCVNESGV